MNKIKMAFIAVAILAGVGGAFATKPCVQCEHDIQYVAIANGYTEAGRFGVDYFCATTGGTCTYYKPDPGANVYVPCRTGTFMWINANGK